MMVGRTLACFCAWSLLAPTAGIILDCDQMFIHTNVGAINGTFGSPFYGIQNYPKDLQCIYTFVAKPNYRVKLVFDDFELTGTAINCQMDYLDIYSKLSSPEVELMSQKLSGRYCGSVSPGLRISLYHVLVLVFHVRAKSPQALGFHGTYEFISGNRYVVGTPAPPGICGFTITPKQKRKGTILSPTYPGAYPKDFNCYYRLKGNVGQRIRVYMSDFDIYFGGEHCPYDQVVLYDGDSNRAPIIRKLCGMQLKLEFYSKGDSLYIEFNTTDPPHADHRGFIIEYEFSSRFVDVSKMMGKQPNISHMRGTECDMRVRSNRETTHVITSPNFPQIYPANTNCTYIIDGLKGVQSLEKILLTFQAFSIPSNTHEALSLTQTDRSICSGGFVGVILQEDSQLNFFKGRMSEVSWDHILCSSESISQPTLGTIDSSGSRAVVFFHSEALSSEHINPPKGFRASVTFETDFGIPGIPVGPASNKCEFKFEAWRGLKGSINSPRYPANYPLGTNCTYHLIGRKTDRVRVFFEQFGLFRGLSKASECKDWVELYDVMHAPDGARRELFIARYCSKHVPGPLQSRHGSYEMKVVFHSDAHGTNTGFKADYDFARRPREEVPSTAPRNGCGGRLGGGGPGGWFASPNYPARYFRNHTCVWEISARPGYRVLLQLIDINVEGAMFEEPINCQSAVIRVYANPNDTFTDEFCGEDKTLVTPIMSKRNVVKVSFMTAPEKVNGLKGFNMSWTEVKVVGPEDFAMIDTICDPRTKFRCRVSNYCIDKRLMCNEIDNCGDGDKTDESKCDSSAIGVTKPEAAFSILLTACLISVLSAFLL